MNPAAHFRAGDWLTVLLGMLLVAWLAATVWLSEHAQRVIVRAQGQIVADAPLVENRQIQVAGPLGISVIQIAERRVRVVSDPGPRQYCVRQGWLARAGDAALCLPNQVSVELRGGTPHLDSLTY